jgi:hypothetical protein
MVKIVDAILAIDPEADIWISGDDISTLNWHHQSSPPITNEQILVKQAELQAAYDALAYSRAREAAYPEFKDFAEAYTEKEIGGDSTKWDAYVIKYNLVRSNNPKP